MRFSPKFMTRSSSPIAPVRDSRFESGILIGVGPGLWGLPRMCLLGTWVNKPPRAAPRDNLIKVAQQYAQYVSCQELPKEATI